MEKLGRNACKFCKRRVVIWRPSPGAFLPEMVATYMSTRWELVDQRFVACILELLYSEKHLPMIGKRCVAKLCHQGGMISFNQRAIDGIMQHHKCCMYCHIVHRDMWGATCYIYNQVPVRPGTKNGKDLLSPKGLPTNVGR